MRFIERVVLGAGMSLMAFVLERRVLKALKRGEVRPAPRTAEDAEEVSEGPELTATPEEIGD